MPCLFFIHYIYYSLDFFCFYLEKKIIRSSSNKMIFVVRKTFFDSLNNYFNGFES